MNSGSIDHCRINLVPGPGLALALEVVGSANPLPEQSDNLLEHDLESMYNL